jgi:hypothetical protein
VLLEVEAMRRPSRGYACKVSTGGSEPVGEEVELASEVLFIAKLRIDAAKILGSPRNMGGNRCGRL